MNRRGRERGRRRRRRRRRGGGGEEEEEEKEEEERVVGVLRYRARERGECLIYLDRLIRGQTEPQTAR